MVFSNPRMTTSRRWLNSPMPLLGVGSSSAGTVARGTRFLVNNQNRSSCTSHSEGAGPPPTHFPDLHRLHRYATLISACARPSIQNYSSSTLRMAAPQEAPRGTCIRHNSQIPPPRRVARLITARAPPLLFFQFISFFSLTRRAVDTSQWRIEVRAHTTA